jgi:hypothetical protein
LGEKLPPIDAGKGPMNGFGGDTLEQATLFQAALGFHEKLAGMPGPYIMTILKVSQGPGVQGALGVAAFRGS